MSIPIQIFPLRIGANPSITIQLYDRGADAPVNLTGFTGWSASALAPDGSIVAMDSAIITDAVNGKVKVSYGTGAFFTVGVYHLNLRGVDTTGKTQIYPYEAGQLRIRVA